MTFKPNAVKRTVTGTFQRPDGVPSEGTITIEFSDYVMGREESVIYTPQKVEIELDEDGYFSEDLAITDPGLTEAELADVERIQGLREANLADLAVVQERINAYLKKLSANQAVTEEETAAYNNDLEEKKDLQTVGIGLTKEYQVLLDRQEQLTYTVVRMRVTTNFKNPKSSRKIECIVPKGTAPIDIANLPKV